MLLFAPPFFHSSNLSLHMQKINFDAYTSLLGQPYRNTVISQVNNHVVRLSVMTAPYPWHHHPNSDETFIGVEGTVIIETPHQTFELTAGSTVTVPKGMPHRTYPKHQQSVNLTVESGDMETIFAE